MSMTILFPAGASLPLATRNSAVKFVNPPLWLPVTLEPMNSIWLSLLVAANTRSPDAGAAAAVVSLLVSELTAALGTLLAGLPQAMIRRSGNTGANLRNNLITIMLLFMETAESG